MDDNREQEMINKGLCGFMILTPTPEHNGGMWCAERLPCIRHKRLKASNHQAVLDIANLLRKNHDKEPQGSLDSYEVIALINFLEQKKVI